MKHVKEALTDQELSRGPPSFSKKEETMPRFYIDFQNGGQVVRDDVGKDLPGLEEA